MTDLLAQSSSPKDLMPIQGHQDPGMYDKTRPIILCLLILALVPMAQARVDPQTGVIRMLHIGKAFLRPVAPGPTFVKDPRISWMPVPAHAWSLGEEAKRNLRIYMPRSQQELLDKYDVIVEDGMYATDMPPNFINWLIEGMENSGLGFVMADDSSSFATSGRHPSWYLTRIGEILPVDDTAGLFGPGQKFHCIPRIPDHPLTRQLNWNEVWISSSNKPWMKEGATMVGEMSPTHWVNEGKPYMCYWMVGKGVSFAYVHKWHIRDDNFYDWPYHEDVLVHLIYFAAQAPFPDDVLFEHRVRGRFDEVYQKRLYIISFIEFADKFGANLRDVELGLIEAGEAYDRAKRSFIDAELNEADSQLVQVSTRYDELTELAFDLWNRAVFWVFLIEWLAVTGTSMVAGYVLWTLMVKRRLYKEVAETRVAADRYQE